MKISFPYRPNSRNAMGEPVTVSKCGFFRIQQIGAEGFYCHHRTTKSQPWLGIPGQPFASLESAIAACGRVPRTRRRYGRQLGEYATSDA